MRVQVKISNGDKEVCAVVDEVQYTQTRDVIDILHEFFSELLTLCDSKTLK